MVSPNSKSQDKRAARRSTNGLVLESLLRPMPVKRFFRDFWEKQPCLIDRQRPGGYPELLSIADVDSLISLTAHPSSQQLRLVRADGETLAERSVAANSDGSVDVYSVYGAYHEGYTAIVNSVDTRWKPIAALCRSLEVELGHRIGANLYLTPARTQGFLPHFDTHDVWVLQLEGTKRWRIYGSPFQLPLESTQYRVERKSLGPPLHELVLNCGDLLYIPRGHIHEAVTSDTSSAHITIGIYTRRWLDVLFDVMRHAAEHDVRLRQGILRPDLVVTPVKADAHLRALLRSAMSQAMGERIVEQNLLRAGSSGNPAPDGHFASLDRIPEIGLDTVLARRPGIACHVAVGREASILFRGNSLAGPAGIGSALRFIAQSDSFAVRELPECLADESKVVLSKRLVKEGLLSIQSAQNGVDHGQGKETQRYRRGTEAAEAPQPKRKEGNPKLASSPAQRATQ